MARAAGNFYKTETVRRVGETLDYCAEYCAIGVVTADYGVGKTDAVKEWRRRTASKIDSVSFEFDEFTAANKGEYLSAIAEMFGLERGGRGPNAGPTFRAVCAYLREYPCLMISGPMRVGTAARAAGGEADLG
jgi:hypothetical protein